MVAKRYHDLCCARIPHPVNVSVCLHGTERFPPNEFFVKFRILKFLLKRVEHSGNLCVFVISRHDRSS